MVDDESVPMDVEAFSGKIQTDTAAVSLYALLGKRRATGVKLRLIFSSHIIHTDGAVFGAWVTSGLAAAKARCGHRLETAAIFLIIGACALQFAAVGPVSAVAATGSGTTFIARFWAWLTSAAHGGVEPETAVVERKVAEFVGLTIVGRTTGGCTSHLCAGCFGNQSGVGALTGVASVGRIEHFSGLANLVFWKTFAIDAWPAVQVIAWVR